MTEQEKTPRPQAAAIGPEAALKTALKTLTESLNTLCAGTLSFGKISVTPGAVEAWPEKLAAPLIVSRFNITGDLSGAAFMVAQTIDARAMRALMLGEETSGEDASPELSEDELDAYSELCNNAASAVGASLRETLGCKASVAASPSHSAEDPEKVLAEIGDDCLMASVVGKIADKDTAIVLAFDAEVHQAIETLNQSKAPAKPAEKPTAANVPENVKRILKLPVPIIVVLAEKQITFESAINLAEGSVIEFSKSNNESLDMLVNNRRIGKGRAIKVGENFGLRVDDIGSPQNIVETLR